ncbi:MAG: HEAT repeat domain-containing protein, partial [Candidatus Riflebacteria bacterium]|nr:HEAT repeat domain-containing protein [Candidatus Riflebacteria bacterium]
QPQSSSLPSSFSSQGFSSSSNNSTPSDSSNNTGNTGFELPSLFDLNDNQTSNSNAFAAAKPSEAAPVKAPLFAPPEIKPDETLASKLPDISSLVNNSEGDALPDLSAFSTAEPTPNPSPLSQKPVVNARPGIPQSAPIPQPIPSPSPAPVLPVQNQTTNISSAPMRPSANQNIIDGPVDPSLPQISNSTDISFLIQHANDVANSKPNGYLTRLFELAKSVHEEVALTALQNLFNLKDNRVPPHILELLNNSDYTSQRRFLMLKIVMDTDAQLNTDLLENILVNEKDVIIKSGLVKVFAKNCNQSGVPLLIKCLKDEDPRVRANTVEVIETQQIAGCEQEIIKLLNDSENRVKVNAAKYLVKIGYQQAFLTLRSMLVSPEVWLRDSVIFALGEIADQPSLILLRAALKDPNQGIRLSVLKALARINNNMSRQILKAASGDPDPIVAQVAMQLFEKIKDTPVREDKPNIPPRPMPMTKPSVFGNQPVSTNPTVAQSVPQTGSFANNVSQVNVPPKVPPMNPQVGIPNIQPNNAAPQPNISEPAKSPILPELNNPAPQQMNNSGLPNLNNPVAESGTSPSLPGLNQPPASNPPASNQGMSLPTLGSNPNPNALPKPPVSPTMPSLGNVQTNAPRPVSSPIPPRPASPITPLKPLSQLRHPQQSVQPTPNLPPGSPSFEKPRSAAIYAKLCSSSVDEQRNGMKDVAFVMGQDQMYLLAKAIKLEDESIRIIAVRLLSRKRTPDAKEMLVVLSQDSNDTVSSLAKKALMLMK